MMPLVAGLDLQVAEGAAVALDRRGVGRVELADGAGHAPREDCPMRINSTSPLRVLPTPDPQELDELAAAAGLRTPG